MTVRVAIQGVYEQEFGKLVHWDYEMPLSSHPIDVMDYRGSDSFSVLATIGMSDLAQNVPREHADCSRCELYYCVSNPRLEHRYLLRHLAKYAHRHSTWFGCGHTLPNGDPPEPLFDGSQLCATLFLDPVLVSTRAVGQRIEVAGSQLLMLWVVPITLAELALVRRDGFDDLMDLFQRHQHPIVLDEHRQSYV